MDYAGLSDFVNKIAHDLDVENKNIHVIKNQIMIFIG